jgi:hypothetical protein
MAKEVTVTFRVTENKTFLSSKGTNGDILQMDITGSEIEQDFTKLLRKIHEANEVQRHTADINEWKLKCRATLNKAIAKLRQIGENEQNHHTNK